MCVFAHLGEVRSSPAYQLNGQSSLHTLPYRLLSGRACAGVLQGHKSGVTSVAFSADGTRVVSASTDGFLIVWNIDVRYSLNEDPKILYKVRTSLVCIGRRVCMLNVA